MHVCGKRFAVQRTAAKQLKSAVRRCAHSFARIYRTVEAEAPRAVVDRYAAVVQDETTDRRDVPALRAFRKLPVGPPVALPDKLDRSVVNINEWEDPSAAEEKRQQTKFEGQVSHIGRGPRAKPFGVGNPDTVRIDARLPGENLYMQIAFDAHLAADPVRDIARDRPAQSVPVQEIERNDKGGDNRQNAPTRPEHPRRYSAQRSRNMPPPPIAAWVCRRSDRSWTLCYGH